MSPHILSHIDLKDKIAFCSVCLWTEIHVPNSRPGKAPKPVCMKRFREMQAYHKKVGETRRKKSVWKPRHLLSEVDPVSLTAICSVCGPTSIRELKCVSKYQCANLARANQRKYRRTHYSSRVTSKTAHILSQIDEETKTAICSICGPVVIYIWQAERKLLRRCSNAAVTRIPGATKIRQEINVYTINRYKTSHGCECCRSRSNLMSLNYTTRTQGKRLPSSRNFLYSTTQN